MKAVILAGGLGTRIQELSSNGPKPMVEIGGNPMLWHIMKIYSFYGINDFIICAGFRSHAIKDYFNNYTLYNSDVTFNLSEDKIEYHKNRSEKWNVTVINTGEETMTGGRLKRVAEFIEDEDFCFTYGDAVSDVNIGKLIEHHKESDCLATVTAVQPSGRFGQMTLEKNSIVSSFEEKPIGDGGWINGGFFILSKDAINFIEDDSTIWEQEPLKNLAKEKQLSYYKHEGFWQCMDTLRDWQLLEDLWKKKSPPWKKW